MIEWKKSLRRLNHAENSFVRISQGFHTLSSYAIRQSTAYLLLQSAVNLRTGRWPSLDNYPLTRGTFTTPTPPSTAFSVSCWNIHKRTHSEKSWHPQFRHSHRQKPSFKKWKETIFIYSLSEFILISSLILIYKETKLRVRGVGRGDTFCDNTEPRKWPTGNENKIHCFCVATYKEWHAE